MIWLILGCNEGKSTKENPDQMVDVAFFHGLSEGATWTYRDDGGQWTDTGFELDEGELIRASHLGEGLIEFRRGERWADANPYGSMQWSTESGLSLSSWSLPMGEGSGNYPLSSELIEVGEDITSDWNCVASDPQEGIETYYAVFENVYVFDCTDGGLEGQYVFAYSIGLVQMTIGDNFQMELVAPW